MTLFPMWAAKSILDEKLHSEIMKTSVLYFSRTGNTKRLVQAIADTAKAPIYDIASTQPSAIESMKQY